MKKSHAQSGQTVVEYLLLLAVSISLVVTFYNSDVYRRLFGEGGSIGESIKTQSEFNYRHAFESPGQADPQGKTSRDGSVHPSYYDTQNGGSRFFGAKDKYP